MRRNNWFNVQITMMTWWRWFVCGATNIVCASFQMHIHLQIILYFCVHNDFGPIFISLWIICLKWALNGVCFDIGRAAKQTSDHSCFSNTHSYVRSIRHADGKIWWNIRIFLKVFFFIWQLKATWKKVETLIKMQHLKAVRRIDESHRTCVASKDQEKHI